MRRRARVVLLAAVFLLQFIPTVSAQDTMIAEFEEELRSFRQALPEELPDVLRDSLTDPDAMADAGEMLTFTTFWESLADSLRELLPSAAALMMRLMGLLLCCGLFGGCRQALGVGGAAPAWDLCSALCITLSAADSLSELLLQCDAYMQALTTLVNGVTPIACAVTAASGNLSGAAVNRAALMLLYSLFQNLYTVLLLPAVRLSFCFGIVGSLGTTLRVDALGRCVRKLFTWFLALLGLILTFVIGMQNVIAKSADSFTMRTVKYALGSFIPLVGGALSDALGTAAGSLQLIRSSCGVLCAAALLLLTLPMVLQLVLHRAVLALCQGAAELVGCEREGKLLGEMHGILGSMLALVAIVSLLFLFVLTMMIALNAGG